VAHHIRTIPELLRWRVDRTPDDAGMFELWEGRWRPVTWSAYWDLVRRAAFGLERLGLGGGRRIAVIAPTSLQWDVVDKASMMLGAVVVGVDPVLPADRILSLIAEIGVSVVVIDRRGPLDVSKIYATPGVEHVVVLGETEQAEIDGRRVVPWSRLLADEPDCAWHPAGPSADDPAAIISTSGTTGEPKAVQYNHGQILLACRAIHEALPIAESDRAICWLPLASLFQRIVNLCALSGGAETYFLSEPRRMMDEISRVRPTAFVGVPRVYEKLHDGIHDTLRRMPAARRRLARWALGVGRRAASRRRDGGRLPLSLRSAHWIADRLVLGRLRAVLGGRLRAAVTGTAACSDHVLEFFHAIGIPLLEAYGITENVVPMAMNRLDDFRLGSVGRPLDRNHISLAEDGEILVRGTGVFTGYLGSEREEDRFTENSFYATGDCGRFDEDGYLYITGRKNEVIKTPSGHKVSLTHLEGELQRSELIDRAVVCGDGRGPLIALLALDLDRIRDRLDSIDSLAGADPAISNLVADEIVRSNGFLARYERIPGFLLLAEGLSVDRGELTPSWKIRRRVVEDRYGKRIEDFRRRLDGRQLGSKPAVEWM